jgi:cysteine desulfurase
MNIDLMSISAHKVYGPKGIGALYCRRLNPRVRPVPLIHGGGHERGIRSGTLNVPGIVGLGKALQIGSDEMEIEAQRFRGWTHQMLRSLEDGIGNENVLLNGHTTDRLPHNLNLYIKDVESKALINYTQPELAISAGAACTTTVVEPSHVIMALGYSEERAYCSIRFGLGRHNTEDEVRYAGEVIVDAVNKLKKIKSIQ